MTDSIDPRWAWSPYQPTDKSPWDLKKAGHLFRRAGFGASWTELEKAVKDGPEKTIACLLNGGPGYDAFAKQSEDILRTLGAQINDVQGQAWWLHGMLHSPHPLQEKLTLFWHNHFATSNSKVVQVRFMLGQNQLLRRNALGSFRTMLQEMSKDAAMLVWLDTNLNKKGKPNENYARELMELFSLGIGHYTEDDVREAARAFTGWVVKDEKYHLNAAEHDDGSKAVLGQTGNWNGEDIVRICLEQKSAPYFLVGKLFRFLVSESITPTAELLEPLATQFRKSDYDIAGLVGTILRSNLFFSDQAYRTVIKSPIDFTVGIVRALEGRVGTLGLATSLDGLGQKPFYPPSVKGWDGGTAWINSTTLLMRQNLALAMTSTQDDRFGRRTDPSALVRKYGKQTDEEVVDFFVQLFMQGDLSSESRQRLLDYMAKARAQSYPVFWTPTDVEEHRIRAVCHLVLTQPEFQLA